MRSAWLVRLLSRSVVALTLVSGVTASSLTPPDASPRPVVPASSATQPPVGPASARSSVACTPSAAPTALGSPAGSAWRVVGESVVDPHIWSGHSVAQAVVADGSATYVAYYDSDRQLTVGRRGSPQAPWTVQRIADPDARVTWDSHNGIELGIDDAGGLHIAANMHDDPLRYWYTGTPSDLTTIERVQVLVDRASENEVTYPRFAKRPDGSLAFTFRSGSSGAGDTRLYAFDAVARRWSDLIGGPLLDGEGQRNAYLELTSEPNEAGWFEAIWLWRSSPDAATNSRLSYMRSRDLSTWETASGDVVQLPVRYSTTSVIVDDIPEGGGILNGSPVVGAAPGAAPVIAYYRYDADGNHQIFGATPELGRWRSARLTTWQGRFPVQGNGTLGVPLSIDFVGPAGDGRVRIDYRCGGTPARAGSLFVEWPSLTVLGESQTPDVGLPVEALRPVAGSAEAPAVASALTETASGGVAIVWQSQGSNQDRPFPTTPAPQPLRVLDLVRATPPGPPSDVQAQRAHDGLVVSWTSPRDDGGRPVLEYVAEYSVDGGTWERIPAEDMGAGEARLEAGAATVVDIRVAARNALGSSAHAEHTVFLSLPGANVRAEDPAATRAETPESRAAAVEPMALALLAAAVLLAIRLRSRRSGQQ